MTPSGVPSTACSLTDQPGIVRRGGLGVFSKRFGSIVFVGYALSLIFQLTCFTTRYATHTRG